MRLLFVLSLLLLAFGCSSTTRYTVHPPNEKNCAYIQKKNEYTSLGSTETRTAALLWCCDGICKNVKVKVLKPKISNTSKTEEDEEDDE